MSRGRFLSRRKYLRNSIDHATNPRMSLADSKFRPLRARNGSVPQDSLQRADSLSGLRSRTTVVQPAHNRPAGGSIPPSATNSAVEAGVRSTRLPLIPGCKQAVRQSRETGEIVRRDGSRSVTADCGRVNSWPRRPDGTGTIRPLSGVPVTMLTVPAWCGMTVADPMRKATVEMSDHRRNSLSGLNAERYGDALVSVSALPQGSPRPVSAVEAGVRSTLLPKLWWGDGSRSKLARGSTPRPSTNRHQGSVSPAHIRKALIAKRPAGHFSPSVGINWPTTSNARLAHPHFTVQTGLLNQPNIL